MQRHGWLDPDRRGERTARARGDAGAPLDRAREGCTAVMVMEEVMEEAVLMVLMEAVGLEEAERGGEGCRWFLSDGAGGDDL